MPCGIGFLCGFSEFRRCEHLITLKRVAVTYTEAQALEITSPNYLAEYVERIIFTGYFFIDVPELTAKLWHDVMKCEGAVRFVSLCALPPDEDGYIRKLCNDGNCVGVSRGYISGVTLHITSGFLTNLDHEIVKFNRRGKRASADVTLAFESGGSKADRDHKSRCSHTLA